MIGLIFYVVIFIIVSALIMAGTNFLYDLSTITIPGVALLMIVFGISVGLITALKNTVKVYKKVYSKKGNRR